MSEHVLELNLQLDLSVRQMAYVLLYVLDEKTLSLTDKLHLSLDELPEFIEKIYRDAETINSTIISSVKLNGSSCYEPTFVSNWYSDLYGFDELYFDELLRFTEKHIRSKIKQEKNYG